MEVWRSRGALRAYGREGTQIWRRDVGVAIRRYGGLGTSGRCKDVEVRRYIGLEARYRREVVEV